MSILVENAYLVTLNEKSDVVKNGALYIEKDKIVEIGTTSNLHEKYKSADEIINAKGSVVMPGFTCAHMHFYSAFATGMSLPPFPSGFLNVLKNMWWKIDQALDKDAVYYSALLGYIQAVKSGTTSVIDHHASPKYVMNSLDEIENAARKLGVRSNLAYEVTDRNGPEEAQLGLDENERFIKKVESSKDDLISGLVGLHASFTLTDQSLDRAASIVKEYETGVHVHVAEDKDDMTHARQFHNLTVLERLEKHNLLNEKSLIAHCIHIEDSDFAIVKRYNANISHQARSNMNNAVGTMRLLDMVESGLTVGMGTDGMSADMKPELMSASFLHKHSNRNNTVGTVEAYNALMKTNPQIMRKIMGVETGSLKVNAKADLIITNYYPKSRITPENELGHVMFGVTSESVKTTIIDGRIAMKDFAIPEIDEAKITEICEKIATDVWNRVPDLPDYSESYPF